MTEKKKNKKAPAGFDLIVRYRGEITSRVEMEETYQKLAGFIRRVLGSQIPDSEEARLRHDRRKRLAG